MTTDQIASTSRDAPHPRRWAALAVVLVGAFVTLVDTTVVNVAIPSIQTELGATYAQAEWVIAGYALAYGLLLIAGGRLGDLRGHKPVFIAAIVGFTVTSILCGVAQTPNQLIIARILQGATAGLMYPQVTATIQLLFRGRERGQAYAIFGSCIGLASVLGPLVGGLLIAANLGDEPWRPIFLVNVPLGVVTAIVAARVLPASRVRRGWIDSTGLVLVSAALFAVTFALIEGRRADWAWWIYALMATSVLLFGAFAWWERRQSRRGRDVVFHPHLLSQRSFAVGSLIALLFFAGFSSLFFTLSLYFQQGLGLSAIAAGAATVPFAVGAFVGAAVSEVGERTLGHRVVHLGAGLVLVGLIGVIVTINAAQLELHALVLAPSLLVAGVGCGLVIAPLLNLALAGVMGRQAGAAAGIINTSQRLGTAIGIALVGVVLLSALGAHADTASRAVSPSLVSQLRATGLPANASSSMAEEFRRCFNKRAKAHDPTVAPPGCPDPRKAAATPLGRTFERAARLAVRRNYTHAIQVATVFNIVTVTLTFALAFFLAPRRRRSEVSDVSPASMAAS